MFKNFGCDLRAVCVQSNTLKSGHTRPSSCTVCTGISASISTALAIDAGIASYVGAAGTGAVDGAGSDAARAAAIEVGPDAIASRDKIVFVELQFIFASSANPEQVTNSHCRGNAKREWGVVGRRC